MISDVINLVDRGRRGESVFIPTRYKRFGRYFGTRRALYSYIGGDSGTGKSAFAQQTWILDTAAWMMANKDQTDTKLKIFAWIQERPIARTKAKWICHRLWQKYGILIDTDFLLGEGVHKSRLPDDIYQKIVETKDYFYQLDEYLELYQRENPTGIRNKMIAHAEQNGKIILKDYKNERTGEIKKRKEYVPDDPNLITIVKVDHLGILGDERNFTKKQKIDKMTEYGREFRDRYGFSPVFVNQFNRNKSDSTRRTKMTLVPEDSDFDTSSDPYKDSDLTLGILDPYKYKIKDHMGYKIPAMVGKEGSRFRMITVMKNTYGPADIHSGFGFVGECGQFNELPRPENMDNKYYQTIRNPGEQASFTIPANN